MEACRSAPNRDPGELGSITLMLPRNRPGGGVPIGAGRDPIKAFILEAIPMPSPTFRVGSRLGAETQLRYHRAVRLKGRRSVSAPAQEAAVPMRPTRILRSPSIRVAWKYFGHHWRVRFSGIWAHLQPLPAPCIGSGFEPAAWIEVKHGETLGRITSVIERPKEMSAPRLEDDSNAHPDLCNSADHDLGMR